MSSVIMMSDTARLAMKRLVAECILLFFSTTWHTSMFPKRDMTIMTEYATIRSAFTVGFWDSGSYLASSANFSHSTMRLSVQLKMVLLVAW